MFNVVVLKLVSINELKKTARIVVVHDSASIKDENHNVSNVMVLKFANIRELEHNVPYVIHQFIHKTGVIYVIMLKLYVVDSSHIVSSVLRY